MNTNLTVYDTFPQNSPPWDHVRLGLLTGSEYNLLLRKGKGGGESITRRRRIYDCAHELISGERPDTRWGGNKFSERGHALEQEALELYLDTHDHGDSSRPAFIRDNRLRTGVSPDMVFGASVQSWRGLLEVKTMAGGMFLELMDDPRVPPEHVAQCQGLLLVTGCEWLDLMIYSPPHAPYVTRVLPIPEYQRELREALLEFNKEVERVVLKARGETVKTCQDRLDARLEEIIEEWKANETYTEDTEDGDA